MRFRNNRWWPGTALLGLSLLMAGMLTGEAAYGAAKGMIKVVTEPGDAKVFINGKRKGNSPAKAGQSFALKLREGEYVLEAVKAMDDGFHEYYGKKEIFVASDSLQTINLALTKRVDKKKARARFLKKYPQGFIEPQMVKVSGGSFRMGDTHGGGDSDEKPVHRVSVDTFYMGIHEVTFAEWDACVNMGGCSHAPDDEGWGRGRRPVINVSWEDAQGYIKWLNRKTGKRYRLPTEAEWEYACRSGGKAQKYCGGDNLDALGWYDKNSGGKTQPVGGKQANGLGLYDMSGNVYEWVQDWYKEKYYGTSVADNPEGPSSGSLRVRRGGGWYGGAGGCRSAFRDFNSPGYRDDDLGFRLLRTP